MIQDKRFLFLSSTHRKWRIFYKALCLILLLYALVVGLTKTLPDIGGNIQQSSRNLFYHVPMWFTMYLMMFFSWIFSVLYLWKRFLWLDRVASEAATVGIFFGMLGLSTGIVWSRVTWGELLPDFDTDAWWIWDPKQTLALASVLMYGAYLFLRSSMDDSRKKALVSGIYNMFAFVNLIPLTYIIPKLVGGLHPGTSETAPVFSAKGIGESYRLVFYPAIIGFMLLGCWILELRIRTQQIKTYLLEKQINMQ
ncbi:MAG: cytochrome c biogenesis protein CcsA [Bacteroidia bacterium]|nr:cytochrome c biogenesis protein CcsA [Bacteroidia bacterium]